MAIQEQKSSTKTYPNNMYNGMEGRFSNPENSSMSEAEDITQRIIGDVIESFQQRRSRQETMVFQVIRGGNVQLVRDTLQVLTTLKHNGVKQWILGTPGTCVTYHGQQEKYTSRQRRYHTLLRYIFLLLTSVYFIATTPIFYMLNSIIFEVFKSASKKLTNAIDLPLAFAVFSGNPEMVDLYSKYGITIYQTDEKGNNIFHYLSDLTQSDKDKAVRCYELIMEKFSREDIRTVLLARTNDKGCTAMDSLASGGSLQLLTRVMETEGVFRHTQICVTRNIAKLRNEDYSSTMCENEPVEGQEAYNVYHYDVSQYEQGDGLKTQTLLLNLLASRDISEMEEEEVTLFSRPWIKVWSQSKLKASSLMYSLCKLFNLVCLTIFIYLLFLDEGYYPTVQAYNEFMQGYVNVIVDKIMASNESLTEVYREQVMEYVAEAVADTDFVLQYCKPNVTKILGIWLNECESLALDVISEDCEGLTKQSIMLSLQVANNESSREVRMILIITNLIICVLQLAIDLSYRMCFLFLNFPTSQGSLYQGMVVFFTRKIPGNYVNFQLNNLFSFLYILYYLVDANVVVIDSGYYTTNKDTLLENILVFLLLLQLLNIIHMLRFVPVVSLFVLTTIKLVRNLLEFLAVFLIITGGFACMFQYLLKDPICPLKDIDGFENFSSSFYESFLTILGNGNIPVRLNLSLRISYGLFGLISVVMLLNLIIAVMGHTADRVMSNPWKDVLRRMDRLDESLYAEALIYTICYPLKFWFARHPYGLVHKFTKGHKKVFIKVES